MENAIRKVQCGKDDAVRAFFLEAQSVETVEGGEKIVRSIVELFAKPLPIDAQRLTVIPMEEVSFNAVGIGGDEGAIGIDSLHLVDAADLVVVTSEVVGDLNIGANGEWYKLFGFEIHGFSHLMFYLFALRVLHSFSVTGFAEGVRYEGHGGG
jgi:hypothetical protein